jgi:hypothetical protein
MTDTCPFCSAPEGCRTGAYYSGKWRERRSIDCYERQIKNLTEQLAQKDELYGVMMRHWIEDDRDITQLETERDAATAELERLREGVVAKDAEIEFWTKANVTNFANWRAVEVSAERIRRGYQDVELVLRECTALAALAGEYA